MPTRSEIPKKWEDRLLLSMDAARKHFKIDDAEVRRRTGYTSSRIANYKRGRNHPKPDTVEVLGMVLEFNPLWFYNGNLKQGITTNRMKAAINAELDAGWRPERQPEGKRGRPSTKKKIK